ncbi:hypothetical protein ABZY58_11670 [Micromonospora tulbaghiae]|uniref:hypothetical protein n=1 Tax=Micromonospora tulbaghiae TaxID=479978 RepID=UPI0033A944A0
MPTQARVEIKPRDDGLYQLIVDGVDISHVVSAHNFRIDWVDQRPVISLELLPDIEFTADMPDAILRLAASAAEQTGAEPDTAAGGDLGRFLIDMRRDLDLLLARTRPPASQPTPGRVPQ